MLAVLVSAIGMSSPSRANLVFQGPPSHVANMSRWRAFNIVALGSAVVMILITLVYIPLHDHERFSYTQAFTSAVVFETHCLGMECRPSLQYEAARRAAYDNPAVVGYLELRFDHSPRAAQFYIAFIARAHDMESGQALFKKLAATRGETMDTMSFDTIRDDADVGELARAFLSHPEWKLFRSP